VAGDAWPKVTSATARKIARYIRVARFFLVHATKTVKNVPNELKNVPNGYKIPQISIKYSKWQYNI
jgi:hypothetical protein